MEKSVYTVRKRARKFKKLFEKISVNTLPWEINGTFYFLISYLKFSNLQGMAVLSDNKKEEAESDARKAHKPLFQFYRLMNHIHVTGKVRVSINDDFFTAPLALSEQVYSEALEEGHALIQSLYDKQTYFKNLYADFFAKLAELQKKGQPLTEEELELAIHTSASLEVLHYEIMRETAENTDCLNQWVKAMKEEELWDKLKQNHRVFYFQLLQNEENMRHELENLPVVKHKNPEKMLKLTKDKYRNFKDDIRKQELKDLRYPY
ncbi:hypothetical protein [Salipaludibacillus aurantiacus]|uniref:Uncharacterized protein n=1 Tax=Salipaludibacillus aurantiacus TaxID=1601833 RepID=A0A1H9SLG4_9BACI|nr:hypothetical protein [Salipaludibacillus aurantiacus]SER85728.1 hypothetical protein SAMN05518684_104287 [Salipaludibacillus aurantiacus]